MQQDYAVRTGELPDGGLGEQKAFPCLVPPVSRQYDFFPPVPTAVQIAAAWGPTVAAGGRLTGVVILDQDYHYKLLCTRYQAFKTVAGINYFFDPLNLGVPACLNWSHGNFAAQFAQAVAGARPWYDPMWRYLQVRLTLRSAGERTIYGETRNDITGRQVFASVDALQGNDSGCGEVRTPYLISKEGTVEFDILNTSPWDLTVHYVMYGMKVRV